MDSEEYYKQKYLKYKMKYLALKGAGYRQGEYISLLEPKKTQKMNELKEEIGDYLDNAKYQNAVLIYPYKEKELYYSLKNDITNNGKTTIHNYEKDRLFKLKISYQHYSYPTTYAIENDLYYIGVIYSLPNVYSANCDALRNSLKLNDFQYQITGTANDADNSDILVTLNREVEEEISAKITDIEYIDTREVKGKNVYFYTAKLGENLTTVKPKLTTDDVVNQKIVVFVSGEKEQIIDYLMKHIDASQEPAKATLKRTDEECVYDGILGISIIPGNVLKSLYNKFPRK
jgi:hypothetical protein